MLLAFALTLSLSGCLQKPQTQEVSKVEKVELKFWNLYDDSSVFKGQIQAYESKHPNVKIVYRKFSNIQEYEQLLINEIAQGEGPDIFAIQNTWVDKHAKKISQFPIGKTTIPMNAQMFDDTFFHVATTDLVRSNNIYAIPLFIDTLALYYNKQIFRDNIPNTDKPGETWEEIKTQTSQITKENNSIERFAVSGMAMGRSDNISRAVDIFSALLPEFGVKLFNDVRDRAVFAAQQGVIEAVSKPFFPFTEALSLFSSFGNPSFKNYSWNKDITSLASESKELNPFLRGKVAMIFGYSYLYQDLLNMRKQLKTVGESVVDEDDIGVIEFPQLLSFTESGKRKSLASYFPLTVSRNSKNPGYSWDFIQYLSSKESMMDYHEKTHKPSSRKDLVDDQMVEPIYGVFARQASYAESPLAASPVDAEFLGKVFEKAIDEASQNKKTLEDITIEAQSAVNCQIEKKAKMGEVDVDCLNLGKQ